MRIAPNAKCQQLLVVALWLVGRGQQYRLVTYSLEGTEMAYQQRRIVLTAVGVIPLVHSRRITRATFHVYTRWAKTHPLQACHPNGLS